MGPGWAKPEEQKGEVGTMKMRVPQTGAAMSQSSTDGRPACRVSDMLKLEFCSFSFSQRGLQLCPEDRATEGKGLRGMQIWGKTGEGKWERITKVDMVAIYLH